MQALRVALDSGSGAHAPSRNDRDWLFDNCIVSLPAQEGAAMACYYYLRYLYMRGFS